jgi:1,2-diacylglycerol 3-alpha-glucosyltransferase
LSELRRARAPRRIVVNWITLGPYHHARLAAAARQFAPHDVDVVALATAAKDQMYDWAPAADPQSYAVDLVFPGSVYQRLHPREIGSRMWQKLEALDPVGVAIPSYATPEARAALAWCRRRKRIAVIMSDSKRDDAPRRRWREWMKRSLVADYDAALVSGTRARDYLCELGMRPEVIRLGYDVVDNEFFAERAAQYRAEPSSSDLPGLGLEESFFLASARLIPRKNIAGLIGAYARYRSVSPAPWGLVILGDGPERPALLARVEDQGIEGVTFAGHHSDPDLVVRYYAAASCFVHPPLQEQWGLVVNEAMAARLPVIVSAEAGCAPQLVQDAVNGYVFGAADEGQLADLMQRMSALASQELDAFGAASQAIVAEWSPDRFASGLWEAFAAGTETSTRSSASTARAIIALARLASRQSDSFFTTAA